MRAIWLLTICTAASWLYLFSTFTPASITVASPFIFPLLIGYIGAVFSFGKNTHQHLSVQNCWLLPVLVLFLLLVPFPYNIGGFFILTGLIIGFAGNKLKFLTPFVATFFITGFIFLIQSAVNPIYNILFSRYHEIQLLNQVVFPFLKLFGLKASISEGIIYLPTFENLLAYPGLLEKGGLYLLFHILVGGFLILTVFSRSLKQYLLFIFICLFYAIIRYVFMIFIFTQVNEAEIFWNPILLTISYLPLAFFLGALLPLPASSSFKASPSLYCGIPLPAWSNKDFIKGYWKIILMFFIAFFSLFALFGFYDPGAVKEGRVLVDEKHSDWEWSTHKFDTTWFGSQSSYNYYCMIEYLDYYYQVDQNNDKNLSVRLLADYDVLILKTPTQAFSTDEIDSIVDFVKKGGGLWMIGDHTNIFGMSYYFNFLAKKFNIFFHYDSTYDLDSGKLSFYKPPEVFPHPAVLDIDSFLFATSCTLDAPLTAENIMLGYGLRSRLLAYSGRGFFEYEPTHNYEFGLFLQSVGIKYGKGRVAAFSDSTCFSNFYMFIPGKPELTLGTVEWLNRENRFNVFYPIFGIIALLFIFFGVKTGCKQVKEEKNKIAGMAVFAVLFAAAIAIPFFGHLTKITYAIPTAHTDYPKICFEEEYSDFILPVKELVDKNPKNYHTFFVWTQRKGYVPSLEKKLQSALQIGDIVVLINPIKPFVDKDITMIKEFIEKGGRLLVMDGPQNTKSTSNQLLSAFGMKINFNKIKKSRIYNFRGKDIASTKNAGTVTGGTPYLGTYNKKSIFSIAKYGKGSIGVMTDSMLFANPHMGGTQIKPNRIRREIYNIEFYIIDILTNSKKQ